MQQDAPAVQQWSICPPTPDINKRRKTKVGGNKEKFMYNLDPLEEEEGGPPPQPAAPSKKQQPAAPSKQQPAAPSKNVKQTSLQSWFSAPSSAASSGGILFANTSRNTSPCPSPPRETASTRHSYPQAQPRKTAAAACNTNPFVRESLTEQERRTPSRPLPMLEGGTASRYLQDFEELRILGRGGAGDVYLARRRMDGCLYAIKRGQAVQRSKKEREALFSEVRVPVCAAYTCAYIRTRALRNQMPAVVPTRICALPKQMPMPALSARCTEVCAHVRLCGTGTEAQPA
eukprot:3050408-Rhodomonas_salina.2